MSIDPRYIPAFSIEDVLLDKDTGAPLAGGLVYFEQDDQRGVLKPIYQITGTSPNYTYIQLPNPMTLSAIGTFQDSLDNPVIPYFYPYDAEGNVEYYYVRVTSSGDVPQFAREAVPYVTIQDNAEVLSVITNEISNPQFSEVKFDTSAGAYTYNFSGASNQVVSIAPDWDLVVSCATTGSVTVTQSKPIGSLNIITNPGTILTISSAGMSKVQLRQRIYGSPNLWGSGYLSGTFVGKTYSGTDVTVNMYYSQSNGIVVDEPIVEATLPASGTYKQTPGSFFIPASTSTEAFPTAYVDIYFDIPLSIQIDLTSVMVAFTGSTSIADINYDQESLARQIDHLYHYAYPIVPVGTIIDYAGFTAPAHYLLQDGAAYDRVTYNLLFNTITTTESVTLTSGVATFTVVSAANYRVGMGLEGTGIAAYTTIINISGTTITMSSNATASATSTVRFFAAAPRYTETVTLTNTVATFTVASAANYQIGMAVRGNGIPTATVISNIVGTTITISNAATFSGASVISIFGVGNGDGTTTFNVFNLIDNVMAGAGGSSITPAINTGNGGSFGYPTHILTVPELAPHTHDIYNVNVAGTSSGAAGTGIATPLVSGTPSGTKGDGTPFTIVQPTTFMRKYIRFE